MPYRLRSDGRCGKGLTEDLPAAMVLNQVHKSPALMNSISAFKAGGTWLWLE
jgi:hypothetical protein